MRGSRKPIELEILQGCPGKSPLPEGIPKPPISDEDIIPPYYLDKYGLEEWDRVVGPLHAMKIFSGIDRQSLAAYCESYSTWRKATDELHRIAEAQGNLAALEEKTGNGIMVQHHLIGVANTAKNDMVKIATNLGMTAIGRTKLGVKPEKGKSKFSGLVGVQGGRK
jgi:P27 family predicted phage terminase small subunit